MPLLINHEELKDRIYGCWLGKNIGGTLGGPFEGTTDVRDVTGYTTPSGEPLPNDDLDLQLVWLKAVQDKGPLGINNRVLGEYWLNYIPPHWNEYGINKGNQRAGLHPPISGEYGNSRWKNSNGAWIRSEIWACLAPGCPDIAIKYAYEDASVDHGGGEGTWAALFTAAVQSAAFVVHDRDELIKIGLSKIPPDCRVAQAVKVAIDSHKKGLSWKEAREAVVKDSEDLGWFQAPANVAFVIIGWLYGEGDFSKSICIAVGCGDDTDCTGATLGATLGIILGKKGIPKEWAEPLGDKIVTVAIDRGSYWPPAPLTLADLTERVMHEVAASLHAHKGWTAITHEQTNLADLANISLTETAVAESIWAKSPFALEYDFVHSRVILDYCKEPDVRPGEPFKLKVRLINQLPDTRHFELNWILPDSWEVNPGPMNHTMISQLPNYSDIEVEIIPSEYFDAAVFRGILEIVAPGRPTVGLVPLIFFAG